MGNQFVSNTSNKHLDVASLIHQSSNKSISTMNSGSGGNSLQLPQYECPSRTVSPRQPPSPKLTQSQRNISTKIVKIAADFWNTNMNSLSFEQQLEIGVAMYLGMMVKDTKIKLIFSKHFNQHAKNEKIERISLKFLNMLEWIIRTILLNNDNLSQTLSNLGLIHHRMGIEINHFKYMLDSLHETFAYYFPNTYNLQEKYAIDYTFTLATKMMMKSPVRNENNHHYLKGLDACLKSSVGREYLWQYLQQNWCDELVVYLQAIMKFNNQTTDKGRFMISRNIIEVSIDSKSNLSLNLSYETRKNMLDMMKYFENKFMEKEEFEMDSDVFDDVTYEVYKLIIQNHWKKFVNKIKNMNDDKF